jgi:starch synthase
MNGRIFVILLNFLLKEAKSVSMQNKRVLIISSEVTPYLPQTDQAINSFQIPKAINDAGGQIRIFMPRYGMINERRHQLHEVIRLSGMNMVVNDMDMPLIIKVASIPKERMQVYFIDNEEYFKRKTMLKDENNVLFPDNDERMIFFTKGVIETVKKLNWSPDIIHLHGWFASLFPLYIKTYFSEDPIFDSSKIVTSVYPNDFEGELSPALENKVAFDVEDESARGPLKESTYENLINLAINFSDGVVLSGENIAESILSNIDSKKIPTLTFEESAKDNAYVDFFNNQII